MENLLSLWKVLAQDMGQRCAVDTTLDFQEVERRTKREGLTFLTITLPEFGKAIEKWLESGSVDPADVPGFRVRHELPIFMGKFICQVFDPQDGALLAEPSTDCILALRQLCGLYGKMFLPASPERTRRTMEQFISTDAEVGQWEDNNPLPQVARERHEALEAGNWSEEILAFSRLSMLLFHRVFDRVNLDIAESFLIPKHGPGSTAENFLGNKKFYADWTWRLEEYFSSTDYILPNPRYHQLLDGVNFRDLEDELPIEVIHVPKTAKAPRIIGKEPVCMQYTQQAIAEGIGEGLNEDNILKGFLRLRSQEVNQLLAREGSVTGSLATLDLSEASDRVSNELIRFMTGRWTHLSGAIQACRSRHAIVRLPRIGGKSVSSDDENLVADERRHIVLRKFAPMGSALTFPLEAMVFLTVVLIGIEKSLGRRLSERDLEVLSGRVAVYGDDIIVPTDHVGSVVHALDSFGFKVNSSKSFWTGRFRESCGKDYYRGIDVSYVKFRKMWPDDRRDVEEVISLVSFFNQCNDAHYVETASYLRKKIKKLLGGFFPRVSRDSAILGEWSDLVTDVTRMCPDYQRPLVKGFVIKDHIPENPLDGERALLKYFIKRGDEPLDDGHLQRSGRSKAVSIKLCDGLA